jgi:tRNA 5-methylaminomethyl-2-thiouridine biosynthesis bifunctional protein
MSSDRLYCDPPQLDWSAPTGPRARDYDDVYFSAEDGLEEARIVFLQGCGLPDAWQGRSRFTVGELGFGTGLNALALWQMWRQTAPANAWLDLVTTERHPLSRADAARAFQAWPELKPMSDQLLAQWPSARKGAHRLVFLGDRLTITLFQDDAERALPQVEASVDAWFLDGFAPARNESMWSPAVFDQIGRLSAPGARLGTFTVAGSVRRGLQDAGFEIEKQPGFGRKRERLEARFCGERASAKPTAFDRSAAVDGRVAVIGAGIAGASLACALSRRGREVVLLDPLGPAGGASGAPAGLLTPRLERADQPHVRATLAAFEFARRCYQGLDGFHASGALRLADDGPAAERLAELARLMGDGFEMTDRGLWMADAGWFEPARIVDQLIGSVDVVRRCLGDVRETASGLELFSASGQPILSAGCVVYASGAEAQAVLPAISPSAGQLAVIDGAPPSYPITWGGYASPVNGGGIMVGATHSKGVDAGPSDTALAGFRSAAAEHVPELDFSGDVRSGWSGVRASTPDRLPLAGALPDEGFDARWKDMATGRKGAEMGSDRPLSRRFILSGLGSRGFAHAPLLAESLASEICGETGALEGAGRVALHPARFNWRKLKRDN